jgi:hypothetical protein
LLNQSETTPLHFLPPPRRHLVRGVMETNARFADELLRRTAPGTVEDLQRQFLREYFDALGQGGNMLARAARKAAEESLHPLEQPMRKRIAGGEEGSQHQGAAEGSTESVAVPAELLRAARERTGIGSDAELVAFALSLLIEPDPAADFLRDKRGSLPGLELDY